MDRTDGARASFQRIPAVAREAPLAHSIFYRHRHYLVTTVFAGAMAFCLPTNAAAQTAVPPSNGPCVVVGTFATCTGNVSVGVVANTPGIDTLNVNNLTQNVAPAAGVSGVAFNNFAIASNLFVNVNAPPFSIMTTGNDASGIVVDNQRNGDAFVTAIADISTQGDFSRGIDAVVDGFGSVFVNATGAISTIGEESSGISAQQTDEDGNVSIISAGTIKTTGIDSRGIIANQRGGDGDVTVSTNSAIMTTGQRGRGIEATQTSGAGNVHVTSRNTISTQGRDAVAILAVQFAGAGDVIVNSDGNLSTQGDRAPGINASLQTGAGRVIVTSRGAITTQGERSAAISATNAVNGITQVISHGAINTFGERSEGIAASTFATGDIIVTSNATIHTRGRSSDGISANRNGGDGHIRVTVNDDITTEGDSADGVSIGSSSGSGFDIEVTTNADIRTMGEFAEGIDVSKNISGEINITANGSVTTLGENSTAIRADHSGNEGNINVAVNGAIATSDEGSSGVRALKSQGNGNVTVSVAGSVTTTDGDSTGVRAEQDGGDGNATINVSGSVITNGIDSPALHALQEAQDGDVIVNVSGGTVRATGTNSQAILAEQAGRDGNVLINTSGVVESSSGNGIEALLNGNGVITINTAGSVSGTSGIVVQDRTAMAPATITTSAAITGTGGTAIDLRGDASDTVNLLGGSVVNGSLDFGNGNDGMGGTNPNDIDTLNVLPGFNGTLTFADTGGTGQGDNDLQSAPEKILLSGGGVLINSGTTLVAVDGTGFDALGTHISDLADGIFNVLDSPGPVSHDHSSGTEFGFGAITDDGATGSGARFWGSGFGGARQVGSTNNIAGFDHDFAGIATRIEMGEAELEGAWGLLGGYARSDLGVAAGAGGTGIDSFFGGIYWKRDYGSHRIHAAFVAGASDNTVMRNVGGGTARGEYDGFFYAPSITVSAPVDLLESPLFVSGRASYVGLDLDGYTETGIMNPLTIGGRTISVVNLRGQLSLPQVKTHDDGAHTHLNWSLGLDSTIDAGSDNVNAVVTATPFGFSTETVESTSIFAGLSLTHTSADGARSITFAGEAQSDLNGGFQASGEVRATFQF